MRALRVGTGGKTTSEMALSGRYGWEGRGQFIGIATAPAVRFKTPTSSLNDLEPRTPLLVASSWVSPRVPVNSWGLGTCQHPAGVPGAAAVPGAFRSISRSGAPSSGGARRWSGPARLPAAPSPPAPRLGTARHGGTGAQGQPRGIPLSLPRAARDGASSCGGGTSHLSSASRKAAIP